MSNATDMNPIPRELAEPLRHIAGRSRFLRIMLGFFRGTALTLAVWLAVVWALGSFGGLPLVVRMGLAGVAWGTIVFVIVRYLVPSFSGGGMAAAARMVDAATVDGHERITSAVELSAEPEGPHKGSAELVGHLVRQAERDAAEVDPQSVVSSHRVFMASLVCVPVIFAWLIAAAIAPPMMARGLSQALAPWKALPGPPGATIDVEPGDKDVAQGDTLDINVTVTPAEELEREHKEFKVARASLVARYPGGQTVGNELEATGPLTFRTRIDNIQQPFTYSITTDKGDKGPFTVNVRTRPALVSADVHYTFPAYTRLAEKHESNTDGTLDALVNTHARLTLHANEPLAGGGKESYLLVKMPAAADRRLSLTPVAGAMYAVDLDMTASGSYTLWLVNEHGLANRDPIVRTITARPDLPPVVKIVAPVSDVRVRPTEAVDIKYEAADDFGITGVDVVLQVDGRAEEIVPIPFAHDSLRLADTWRLAVGPVLERANAGADARRIAYQVRVSDNAEPLRNVALTARQFIEIDRAANSLAAQKDAQDAKDLAEAIKQAQEGLEGAEKKLEPAKQAEGKLSPEAKQQADGARQDLSRTAEGLKGAAEKERNSAFGKIAEEARAVADKNVDKAAEDAAKAGLNADKPAARKEDLADAAKQIGEAKKKLGELAERLEKQAGQQTLKDKLADLERRQRELAEAMARDPANMEKYKKQQQDLQKELEKVLAEHPELRKPAEDAAAGQMKDLAKEVDRLAQEQKPLSERIERQRQADHANEARSELSKQQEQLNKEAQELARQRQETLRRAGTDVPKPAMEQAAKDLQQSNYSRAAQEQQAASDSLKGAADKLDAAAKDGQQTPEQRAAAKEAAGKSRELAQKQEQLAHDTAKLGQAVSEAATQKPDANSDQPHKDLAQAMDKAAGEAQGMAQQNQTQAPQAAKAAQAASEALKQAAAEERKAGNAEKSGASDKAAQAQQASADKLEQAREALTGERPSQQAGGQKKPEGQSAQSPQSPQSPANQNSGEKGQGAKGSQGDPSKPPQAGTPEGQGKTPQNGEGGQASGGKTLGGQARSGTSSGQTSAQPGDAASEQAARDVQSARSAQQQAATGDAAAAGRAADSLAQASRELAQGQEGNGTGDTPANGSTAGKPSGHGTDDRPGTGGTGANPLAAGPAGQVPKEVREIGIPPGDWAKLPPAMQQQLLNAAQQKGPPSYQEAIKNYYIRIARMQAEQ